MEHKCHSLEERVSRLENALSVMSAPVRLKPAFFNAALALSVVSLGLLWLGLGWPNHPYQGVVAVLTVLLCYHRQWLLRVEGPRQHLLSLLNCAQLTLMLKLFIGSGYRLPLFWLKYPTLAKVPSEGKWFDSLMSWGVVWEPTAFSSWSVDLTLVQTFLMLITLVGTLFRFQPFVSLTALALVVVSIPAFAEFNWTWVFPAITVSCIALYIQSPASREQT